MAKIRIRRDTAQNWTNANPTLGLGEPGLETDTNKVKYGDGVTAWAALPYASGGGSGASVSVPPSASVGAGTFTALGSTGMNTIFGPDSRDDASLEVDLPFTVKFAGVEYNKVYVSSNSYVAFDNNSGNAGNYSYIPDYNPGQPGSFIQDLQVAAIAIDGADNSYQTVFTLQDSPTTFRIRWEGTNSTWGDYTSPNMIWEMLFDSTAPGVVKLDIIQNARNSEGTTVITDGVSNLGTFVPNVGTYDITTSTGTVEGDSIKFKNPNTKVELVGNTVEVTIGGAKSEWMNPNENVWKIEDWSAGTSVTYDAPEASYYTSATLTQNNPNELMLDSNADSGMITPMNSLVAVRINGIRHAWGGYGQNNGIYTVWLNEPASYTAGDQVELIYRDYQQQPQDALWFDPAESPSGSNNFRGAIIQYHAYDSSAGTVIGTIHVSVDSRNNEFVTHTEHLSGSSNLSQSIFWWTDGDGRLYYRNTSGNTGDVMVHWTAKMFYGSEYYD